MFILGCHRSGTSYLSSVIIKSLSEINKLVDLDTAWVNENPSNPNGHFESKRLKQANNTFLKLIGFSWDYPPLYKPKWDSILESFSLEELRKEFITWIENKSWVDKDPRLSITREIYLHIFLREVMSIFIVRHPFQVINSLYNRDGITSDKGICIWLIYNYHILNSKCSAPTLTVNFNNVETFNEFYANSLSKNINSYLSIDNEKAKELNEFLKKNILLLLNKNSIRASSEKLYENSASGGLIEASIKCFEIFNQNPKDFDFKKATKLYNSYFFSIIDELTNIFPFPYNPSLKQEDPESMFLPNLNYSSKNFTFKNNINLITENLNNKIGQSEKKINALGSSMKKFDNSIIKNFEKIDSKINLLGSSIKKLNYLDKKLSKFIEIFSNYKYIFDELESNIKQIKNQEKKVNSIIESNKKLNNQYSLIKNSKFWRLIRFFDKFLSFLKKNKSH